MTRQVNPSEECLTGCESGSKAVIRVQAVRTGVLIDKPSERLEPISCSSSQPRRSLTPAIDPVKLEQHCFLSNSPDDPSFRSSCFMSVTEDAAPALGAPDDAHRPKQHESTVMDGLSSSKVTGMDP